jgi:hypothetical protein
VLLQADELAPWLLDYMVGASQDLNKLPHFPSALIGRTVKEAAGFIFDCCHGVLLAVEATQGSQRHKMQLGDVEQVRPTAVAGTQCRLPVNTLSSSLYMH